MKKSFPFYKQPDSKDCGPCCLKIISKYYGKIISMKNLRELSETNRTGSSLLKLSEAAETIGFRSLRVQIGYEKLANEVELPCIIHWNKRHFVVVYKIKNNTIYVSDPSFGLITYSKEEFISRWIGKKETRFSNDGVALLLETTPKFYNQDWKSTENKSIRFLLQYLFKYKQLLSQLLIGLLVGSILQLIVPFLTQSIVDVGIQGGDINFIYLILIAQIMLFIGRTSVEVFRGWILLHLSTRINISLVSDFFIKLMNLPIAYFDNKMTGDIMQRINDHRRIQRLLTTSSLNTLFSLFNLIIFGAILIFYSLKIFMIFAIGSILYILWIAYFLKKRKELDYKRFSQQSQQQSTVIELINGMQEIKLHNAERQKRWGWEFTQARLFQISIQNLTLEQTQGVGSAVINEFKNILITITSAILVIEGQITLGMMLSIQYIIGQLNNPVGQMVGFIRSYQDAKISLERLREIHEREDETNQNRHLINSFDLNQDISLNNVSFRYLGSSERVLNNINLIIPANKVTAFVGASGSGKTTLMKLLLKFYEPKEGSINYGNNPLKSISHQSWRDFCGTVMQEGYIFNDTIANNVAVGEDIIDEERLIAATKIANIYDFIQTLSLGFNTRIGNEGTGISMGQKQRMLIARAVYKNPGIIFFDEATSALDSKNESAIMNNLDKFFNNKTVVIIAHRLSTVKNADRIVVMDKGTIMELGSHEELISKKGIYLSLIHSQLELEKIGQ